MLALWFSGGGAPDRKRDDNPAKYKGTERLRLMPEALPAELSEGEEQGFDTDVLTEAVRGGHGLELRNRICTLCLDGRLQEPSCKDCNGIDEAGRVNVDIVGDDGRPIPDFDGWVTTGCGRMGGGNSSALDLPAGPCELTATRFDGALLVRGESVTVDVVAGEEQYQLLEVPADPHGGAGLMLASTSDGFVLKGLIPGTAAERSDLEAGMELVEIDGEDVEGLSLEEVLDALVGPRGTEVMVNFVDADGESHEVTLDRREILGQQLANLIGQPG